MAPRVVETADELRARIMAGRKPRVEPFDTVTAGRVYIGELTGTDRDRAQAIAAEIKDAFSGPGWRGRMAALFLRDAEGNRLFDPIEDAERLNQLPSNFLEAVIDKGNEVNALTREAVEAAKGNSNAAPSGDSTSDSPATLAA